MNDSSFSVDSCHPHPSHPPPLSFLSFILPHPLTPPQLYFVVDKVKANSTSTTSTSPFSSAGGRWRQRQGTSDGGGSGGGRSRCRTNPPEHHSASPAAANLSLSSRRVTISSSTRRLSLSALIERTAVSRPPTEIASFTLTGQSLTQSSEPQTSRNHSQFFRHPAKYFKLCSQIIVSASARRKQSSSGKIISSVPAKKTRKPRSPATVSVRVVSKIKKQSRSSEKPANGSSRTRRPRAPSWKASVEKRLMFRKKAFPVHQKVISDPCQFNAVTGDSDCDFADDVQKAVKLVLKSKVMLIGADQSLNVNAYSNKINGNESGGEVTVSAEYLANTYDYYHQRHVDNLKSMIAEHAIQPDESFCQQPERKKIHIREDFYCEADFLMDTELEQSRPLSESSDSSISHSLNEDSMDLLSEDIDKCRIHEQKIKPKITFTHVTGTDFNKAGTKDGSSEKNSKVSSPLLEVPSLFLDLSSEMLRPPLGNM